jgi:hypothetical protein
MRNLFIRTFDLSYTPDCRYMQVEFLLRYIVTLQRNAHACVLLKSSVALLTSPHITIFRFSWLKVVEWQFSHYRCNILSRVWGSVTNSNGFWIGWLDLLTLLLQLFLITINYNNSHQWRSKTRSIPSWTTSVFSSTVTDLVLIYESVTSPVSVVRWLTLHSWTLNSLTNESSFTTDLRMNWLTTPVRLLSEWLNECRMNSLL